jgi:hypothetical protein
VPETATDRCLSARIADYDTPRSVNNTLQIRLFGSVQKFLSANRTQEVGGSNPPSSTLLSLEIGTSFFFLVGFDGNHRAHSA